MNPESNQIEKDPHEFDDSLVVWFEANKDSIITNKDDDLVNNQKTTQKSPQHIAKNIYIQRTQSLGQHNNDATTFAATLHTVHSYLVSHC
jgi:hypothetical protein